MRALTVLGFATLATCLLGACGADDAAPSADDSLDALQLESGARWRAVLRPDGRSASFLARERAALAPDDGTGGVGDDGALAVAAPVELLAAAPAVAEAFLRAWPGLFGAASHSGGLRFVDVAGDGVGGARARFELLADGLPVEGSRAVVVLDGGGRVRAAAGAFQTASRLAAPPSLSSTSAIAAARAYLAERFPAVAFQLDGSADLVATAVAAALRPAWRLTLRSEQPDRTPSLIRRELHIDAATGAVLRDRDGLHGYAVVGSGVGVAGDRRTLDVAVHATSGYALRDETRTPRGIRTFTARGGERLPGVLVTSADPHAWDEDFFGAGAAVDAHAFAGVVYDYLDDVLDRRSIDGRDGAIRLVVHYGDGLANAFWEGRRAVFGDGDASTAPLSAALDVVAHELFHGVTQEDSGLIYEGQSGALNESLSDVFACFVERRAGDGDWTIGEDVVSPPLRDLARPWRTGLPAHMREYVYLPPTPEADMGGVHINSTIPSHAAYLVADRIGLAKTRRIWYRAASVYLTPYAEFAEFAAATRAAAEDLYGGDSDAAGAVDATWRAVGVE